MAYTPFTGFSYATGLASLGQGLGRVNQGIEEAENRKLLLSALGSNPQAAALAAAGQPGLAMQMVNKQREDAAGAAASQRYNQIMGGGGVAPAAGGGQAAPIAPFKTGTGGNDLFDQKAPQVLERLMADHGLTREQAAGIVGNLGHESGGFKHYQELAPTVPGSRGGAGWAQWTGPRRVAFEKWAAEKGLDPKSDEASYGFLTQGEPEEWNRALAAVKQHNTIDGATRAFENTYERSGVKAYGSRLSFANRVFGAGGANPAPVRVAGPGAPTGNAPIQGDPSGPNDGPGVPLEYGRTQAVPVAPNQVFTPQNPVVPPGTPYEPGVPAAPVQAPAPQAAVPTPAPVAEAPQSTDGRVRLAQAGTSDAPLPVSPGQFLTQRQQQRDGLAADPGPFRPPPASPEIEALRQRATQVRQLVGSPGLSAADRQTYQGMASQLDEQYRTARNEEAKAAKADHDERTRLYREQQTELRKRGYALQDEERKAAADAPAKAAEAEAKLRGEFTKRIGTFNEVHDAYGRVIAAVEQREANPQNVSPASDIGLIFGYMKMLDPGSVVREGEFATAQNAGGIPDRVANLYNKALNGQFLTPEQRQDFVSTAERLYNQSRKSADQAADRFGRLAKSQKLDPANVVELPPALVAPRIGAARTTQGSPIPGVAVPAPGAPGRVNLDQPVGGGARQPVRQVGAPSVGVVESGYRYKGGDPGNPASWERVQ